MLNFELLEDEKDGNIEKWKDGKIMEERINIITNNFLILQYFNLSINKTLLLPFLLLKRITEDRINYE